MPKQRLHAHPISSRIETGNPVVVRGGRCRTLDVEATDRPAALLRAGPARITNVVG